MTNDHMRKNGQACTDCGAFIGRAIGRRRMCKGCKLFYADVFKQTKKETDKQK